MTEHNIRRRRIMVWLWGVMVLVFIGWLGLQVRPRPFSPYSGGAPSTRYITLPTHLPSPVERYARNTYGDRIPVITSAVITGRAKMRIGGVNAAARFRFTHEAGIGYRHYIEVTWFGIPIMRVNESYLDGHGRMELPFGVEQGAEIDQGARLALWAEAVWFPALWWTHSGVQWQPVDAETALLLTPNDNGHDAFVARFDPESGELRMLEAMRYRTNEPRRTLWITQTGATRSIDGYHVPAVGSITWLDEGRPWAVFTVESVTYNTDVRQYLRRRGL